MKLRRCFIALVACFVFVGSTRAQLPVRDPTLQAILRDSALISALIEEYYYEPVDIALCFRQIRSSGNISTCLDEYSIYLSPSEWERREGDVNGRYFGVGMILSRRGNKVILSPLPGTPAAMAGILQGDILLRVDEVSVTQERELTMEDLERVRRMIMGDSGVVVILTVERERVRLSPISVVRNRITLPSVEYIVIDSTIGYLKIYSFSDHVFSEFREAIEVLRRRGVEQFVFDVRNNGGGSVSEVHNMLMLFAERRGQILTVQRFRRGEYLTQARSRGRFAGIRAITLVNGNTASASEIFAGVLSEWGISELVGERTFGKGVGQRILPLMPSINGFPRPGSPVLVLTNFHFLLGESRREVIKSVGLEPDYVVSDSLSREELSALNVDLQTHNPREIYVNPRFDHQLRRALEILKRPR